MPSSTEFLKYHHQSVKPVYKLLTDIAHSETSTLFKALEDNKHTL